MKNAITLFQDFAKSVNLQLEYASKNTEEDYLSLFSYDYENGREYAMYLYGENQFDTVWEYEYHNYLTIGRRLLKLHERVLVLGSGDLMNHRFLGAYDTDLIDIDPCMTHFASSDPLMLRLNGYTPSPNYRIYNRDAVEFLVENKNSIPDYQYIVIDFPVMVSPVADEVKKYGLEKFFSKEMFVDILLRNLADNGLITMQADDSFAHIQHEKHFRSLIEGTDVYFYIYSIDFKGTEFRQFFYAFTKNRSIYQYFQQNITSTSVKPGIFRKDAYFTDLFELLRNNEISYEQYVLILNGK